MLYSEVYCPHNIDEFIYNADIAQKVINLSKRPDFPHIIINGANGSGKKTMANLFITTKYSLTPEMFKVKNQIYEIEHNSKKIDVHIKYSKYHWQVNPSLYGVYDRTIIQELILKVISARPIGIDYNIMIIEEADKLTFDAQQCLRRMLEKSVNSCRFIFLVNNSSSLIDALISRCVQFRLSSPTNDEMKYIMKYIIEQELSDGSIQNINMVLDSICLISERNIKTALNQLQLFIVKGLKMEKSDEQDHISKIIKLMIAKPAKLDNILNIRNLLYNLLVQCISPINLLKKLYKELIQVCPTKIIEITEILSHYEDTLKLNNKPIYHLEGFVISCIQTIS